MFVEVTIAGVVGGILGSAIANFAWRWPDRLEQFVRGRSACESCGSKLGFVDLLPVVGWFIRRGRCANCDVPIPTYYWQIELACALVVAISIALLGVPAGLPIAGAGLALVLMARIDLDSLRLPDVLTLPFLSVGLIGSFLPGWPGPDWPDAVIGALAGYSLLFSVRWAYAKSRGRQGLGMGDVKLFAAAGAWCGWQGLPWVLVIAAASAIILAMVRGIRLDSTVPLPFGPNLAAAIWLVILWNWPIP